MNIVHIGSSNSLSLIPLQALLDSEHHVQIIILDDRGQAQNRLFPVPVFDASRSSLESLAFNYGVPLISVASDWLDCRRRVQDCSPDVIFVACFSRRLPEDICLLPKHGCINLHPSLLPAYRGPDPIFWQFRNGDATFGISLHRVSPELDGGPVLAQKIVSMSDGISYSAACHRLAESGRDALLDLLVQMEARICCAERQGEKQSSYQSFPEEQDFSLSADWTAKRLYNFICAMQERSSYFPYLIDGYTYRLSKAFSFQTGKIKKLEIKGQRMIVPCADGSVEAEILL